MFKKEKKGSFALEAVRKRIPASGRSIWKSEGPSDIPPLPKYPCQPSSLGHMAFVSSRAARQNKSDLCRRSHAELI